MQLPLPWHAPEVGERVVWLWGDGVRQEGRVTQREGERLWVEYTLTPSRWWFPELKKWVRGGSRGQHGTYSFLLSEHPELEVLE